MPGRHGTRPLKAWRYVGVFAPEATICVARVRVGPVRDAFWAIWDRTHGRFVHGAGPRAGRVRLEPGRVRVEARGVRIELLLEEAAGIETVCNSGAAYAWTRKQFALPATAHVELGPAAAGVRELSISGHAIVDDTAAYYARDTRWEWSAGIGTTLDGRLVAWNLVAGINDPPVSSERTVWLDGAPTEPPPVAFAADLSSVEGLRFHREAELARRTNLGVLRSDYRQPIGTFTGELPGGIALRQGYGVMERHHARW